jgi:diaminopimelate decarboxylase
MQAGDILAKERLLPALHDGDLLVMTNCGAYAMCRASRFNARPLPAEVMVKDGHARLVRKRETWKDLLTNQILD